VEKADQPPRQGLRRPGDDQDYGDPYRVAGLVAETREEGGEVFQLMKTCFLHGF
jgi:hypothetical protein